MIRSADGKEKDTERHVTTSADFDYLVIASGFFSTPYTPDIPGFHEFSGRTIHSSALDTPETINSILSESKTSGGKLLVIGGSMSGAEAASALALHLSSLKHTDSLSRGGLERYEVHHVCTKPFWTLPTFLPQSGQNDDAVSFLPLDLVLYNLSRRPPGPVEYGFGPLSKELISKMNNSFRSLVGKDYEICGYVRSDLNHTDKSENDKPQPTFLAIGNDYAEFIRSKKILPTIGRVTRINTSLSDSASVDITLPDNKTISLSNVAAVILATGYKPNQSLSFLPPEVLAELEYDPNDSFLPLILDSKGSMNANVPNLGFVGFYKGPYWGAMEMHARFLGHVWADAGVGSAIWFSEAEEREAVRNFRDKDKDHYRGQLPMADYSGFMESFARELGIPSARKSDSSERPEIVIPAEYAFDRASPGPGNFNGANESIKQAEVEATLDSLQTTISRKTDANCPGVAMAIFRALHGTWNFTRTYLDEAKAQKERKTHGSATFHPRYPSRKEYEKEYLCEEVEYGSSEPTPKTGSTCSVYSLLDPLPRSDGVHIHIWLSGNLDSENQFSHRLVLSPAQARVQNGDRVPGEYIIHGSGSGGRTSHGSSGCVYQYEYIFHLEGVAITSWECKVVRANSGSGEGGGRLEVQTSYTR